MFHSTRNRIIDEIYSMKKPNVSKKHLRYNVRRHLNASHPISNLSRLNEREWAKVSLANLVVDACKDLVL